MMETRVEHAESTASSGFSGRQSSTRCVALEPNSIANISASSSARSGRIAATRPWKSRWACCHFCLGMLCRIRSYVSSRVVGNSFRAFRILGGMHRRRLSSWQYAHRNLSSIVNNYPDATKRGYLHPLSAFREYTDNKFLILRSPSLHCSIILNEKANITVDIFSLTDFFVEGHATRWGC